MDVWMDTWMGGWMDTWMGGWMDGWVEVNSLAANNNKKVWPADGLS